VRILGIETSSSRGSVALVHDESAVCALSHDRENAHAQSIQPLIEQALAKTGWSRTSLDRIAVGIGPGSFTGLRVGIALAQGISEGLGVPLIGIGSLAAMALAAPKGRPGLRCPVLDARRGEFFVAAYTPGGDEVLAPQVASDAIALARLTRELHGELLVLGEPVQLAWEALLVDPLAAQARHVFRSAETDLPDARWTAIAAFSAPAMGSVVPTYVRHAVAVVPQLPPNPLRHDPSKH
jgi:tRNA threonylcarbamoyladenosine biosynthesis protein TsaB